jgi:hypothetical protein
MNMLSSTIVLAKLGEAYGLRLGADADAPRWRHIVTGSGDGALCGHGGTEPMGPLTLWGVETDASERWCSLCAAEAAELVRNSRES